MTDETLGLSEENQALIESVFHIAVGETLPRYSHGELDRLLNAARAAPPSEGLLLSALEEASACLWIPTAKQLDAESYARIVAARKICRAARDRAARANPLSEGEWVLVPRDDAARPFADSQLPREMIQAGQDAMESVHLDMMNYVAGETIDWDDGMIAVAVYRAMLAASPSRPLLEENEGLTTSGVLARGAVDHDGLLDRALSLQAQVTAARKALNVREAGYLPYEKRDTQNGAFAHGSVETCRAVRKAMDEARSTPLAPRADGALQPQKRNPWNDVTEAFRKGAMFALGREPWDDADDFFSLWAIDYAQGKPLPARTAPADGIQGGRS